MNVKWALQRQKGKGLVLVEPKSNAGRRRMVLPEPLQRALVEHAECQQQARLEAAEAWQEQGFVFAQPDGCPIGAPSDWAAWKSLLKTAGVRDARRHDARHTAATLLLAQGVPARVAMQLLGHSQISMTMVYARRRRTRARSGGQHDARPVGVVMPTLGMYEAV